MAFTDASGARRSYEIILNRDFFPSELIADGEFRYPAGDARASIVRSASTRSLVLRVVLDDAEKELHRFETPIDLVAAAG